MGPVLQVVDIMYSLSSGNEDVSMFTVTASGFFLELYVYSKKNILPHS